MSQRRALGLDSLTRAGRSFFLAPSHPINLAVLRLVVFSSLLYNIAREDFARYARLPAELRVPPAGYGPLFELIPFDEQVIGFATVVAVVSCLSALVGFHTRVSALVGCIACLYLFGLPEFFGKISHTRHHLIWFAALLAASPSGDALSVDAAVRSRKVGHRAARASVAHGVPLRFAWLLIGVIYFFPGLAKLSAGPEWVWSDNLRNTMYQFWALKGFLPAVRIDQYSWLCRGAALATVVFEIFFLFMVFSRRLRYVAVAGGLLFHWMSDIFFRIFFAELVVCYAVFFDWDALFRHLKRRVGAAEPSRTESAGPGAGARTGWRGVAVLGSVMLAANLYFGVRQIDSWPFSAYPRFSTIQRTASTTSLEIEVRRGTGESARIRSPLRRVAMDRLLRESDHELRNRQLRALRRSLEDEGAVVPGEVVQFYAITRSTIPEMRNRELRRRLVLEDAGGA